MSNNLLKEVNDQVQKFFTKHVDRLNDLPDGKGKDTAAFLGSISEKWTKKANQTEVQSITKVITDEVHQLRQRIETLEYENSSLRNNVDMTNMSNLGNYYDEFNDFNTISTSTSSDIASFGYRSRGASTDLSISETDKQTFVKDVKKKFREFLSAVVGKEQTSDVEDSDSENNKYVDEMKPKRPTAFIIYRRTLLLTGIDGTEILNMWAEEKANNSAVYREYEEKAKEERVKWEYEMTQYVPPPRSELKRRWEEKKAMNKKIREERKENRKRKFAEIDGVEPKKSKALPRPKTISIPEPVPIINHLEDLSDVCANVEHVENMSIDDLLSTETWGM